MHPSFDAPHYRKKPQTVPFSSSHGEISSMVSDVKQLVRHPFLLLPYFLPKTKLRAEGTTISVLKSNDVKSHSRIKSKIAEISTNQDTSPYLAVSCASRQTKCHKAYPSPPASSIGILSWPIQPPPTQLNRNPRVKFLFAGQVYKWIHNCILS
ncbi:uncharacterized protein PAC_07056 [Phialocephala subalpina]|uniref:Uncharacterized protein n=1 Tax=Phialocephala subalpina TaxID=576137 RepID=A0A1L7WWN4_9HELO|nr:uncharacterized protein PAC_07056 [Phialocephala subalpina]